MKHYVAAIVLFLLMATTALGQSKVTLTGGAWQNGAGTPYAFGDLRIQLSNDAVVSGVGLITAGTPMKYRLDINGNVPSGTQVWGNDVMSPAGTCYEFLVQTSLSSPGGGNPQRVYGPGCFVISGPGPINLNTVIPINPSVIYPLAAIATQPNTFTSTNTHSGSETFTGVVTSCQQNSVLYVGGTITCWSGSDIGAQINSAYAALPVTGGTIVVLPKTGGGSYHFSTPITFSTAHKTVLLVGVGPAGTPNSSQNQGTILEYTPTTATAAILFDDLDSGGSGYTRVHGMRDIALWNNHTFLNGGTGSSAIGVRCGTSTQACQLAEFTGVLIAGFGTGLSITNANSWGWTIDRSSIVSNTIGLTAVGENTAITDSVIAVNGTGISSNCGEINIKGGSLDSNTFAAINYTNSAGACILDLHGVHFENLGLSSGTFGMPYIIGSPNLRVHGGTFIDDCNGVSNCGNQANSTTGYIAIGTAALFDDPQFLSAGRTQNSGVIQVTGAGVSRVSGRIYNQSPATLPTTPATFVGGSQSQFNSLEVSSSTSGIGTVIKQYEGEIIVGTGLSTGGGQLRLAETTTRTAHVSESDCQGNSRTHDLQCSYNGGSYLHMPQVVANGTATMTIAAIGAGNCGATVTVAASGVATTDTITWAFNAAPAGSNAGLVAWPTSNNVNFAYCPGVAETPVAATINWRVMR